MITRIGLRDRPPVEYNGRRVATDFRVLVPLTVQALKTERERVTSADIGKSTEELFRLQSNTPETSAPNK